MSYYINSHTFKDTIERAIRSSQGTLELLKSSILVSLSGAIRVYLAALLLQTNVSMLTCLASGLIIYSVYTLDRTLDSEEDTINRTELNGSIKAVGLVATLVSFMVGAYLFEEKGIVAFAFLPFVTGYLYSKGINLGSYSLKLKGGLGVKNIITGLTWGLSIVGVAGCACKSIFSTTLIFLFYSIKLFINSTIYDFADIKGDIIAGIKTLPVSLGEQKTRILLFGLLLISHIIVVIALLKGVIGFEPLIILYSFICGLVCIMSYTNSDKLNNPIQKWVRAGLVDGEAWVSLSPYGGI